MPSLVVFFVAYVGIGGPGAARIDGQVQTLLAAELAIEPTRMTRAQRDTLVEQRDGAAELVRGLGVDATVAGRLERRGKKQGATLRVVIYDREGTRVSLFELPIGKPARRLGKTELASLREMMLPDLTRLTAPPPEPEPAPRPVVAARDDDDDDLDGLGLAAAVAAPARRAPWLRLAAGAGPRTRRFAPGPAMVWGYRSRPVPAAQLAAELRPLRVLALACAVERTLTMSSEIEGEAVPTSILGWQAAAALRLPLGPLELAALGGVGGRDFVIASAEPAPTPDGHYRYALLGGRVAARLGRRVEVRAFAAYQPVIGGDDTMAPGAARHGVEVGAALEVDATSRLFVLGEGGYQRFTWRLAEGVATDEYPSATISLGARY
jgi:hypothetical protein